MSRRSDTPNIKAFKQSVRGAKSRSPFAKLGNAASKSRKYRDDPSEDSGEESDDMDVVAVQQPSLKRRREEPKRGVNEAAEPGDSSSDPPRKRMKTEDGTPSHATAIDPNLPGKFREILENMHRLQGKADNQPALGSPGDDEKYLEARRKLLQSYSAERLKQEVDAAIESLQDGGSATLALLLSDDLDDESDDEDYEPEDGADDELDDDDIGATPKPRSQNKRRKQAVSSSRATHDKKGGKAGKERPDDVTIEIETDATGRQRTTGIRGNAYSMVTTGRKAAPNPLEMAVETAMKDVGVLSRDETGIVGAHKGHLFALELSGPDIPENIVPQWGNWQANGPWRAAEKAALSIAKELTKQKLLLMYEVQVRYKEIKLPLEQATLKMFCVPVGFHAFGIVVDASGAKVPGWPIFNFYEGDQFFTRRDDKQMGKELEKGEK